MAHGVVAAAAASVDGRSSREGPQGLMGRSGASAPAPGAAVGGSRTAAADDPREGRGRRPTRPNLLCVAAAAALAGRGGLGAAVREVRVLGQAKCLLGAGFILDQIAVQHGATAAAPSGSIPEQANSGARGQAEWAGGIVWLDDPAGALAVSRCVASLGFSGPQVREERRWYSLARWAAHHSGTGRLGNVGPLPPRVRRGLVEDTCSRRR